MLTRARARQLSSPALGLLLVFRTNTAYARWNEARMAWAAIENHSINLARQGLCRSYPPSLLLHALP